MARDSYAGGYYEPGGGADDDEEPDGPGGGVNLGGVAGGSDPSDAPGAGDSDSGGSSSDSDDATGRGPRDNRDPFADDSGDATGSAPNDDSSGSTGSSSSDGASNRETVGSVTRDRGSAGAPGDTGEPTESIGDDSTNSPTSRTNDPRQEIENWSGSDDVDGDRTFDDAGVEGGGRVPGSGLEDFSDADPRRSNQGLERLEGDSSGVDQRRQQLGDQAEQFEQEVLRSLPDRYDEGDIRIEEEQRGGETVLAAEFTQAGEFERAEQFEEEIVEQSSVEDESGVRVVERDGGFAAEFTQEGQEQIVAESLGVTRSDIDVRDGTVIGTSEEGRNALAMSQPDDRQNPTRADDDPADPGGTSEFGTPNESITRERDTGGDAYVSGGDVRLYQEAEEQTTVSDLPESQQQALMNGNPEIGPNTPVETNGQETETADSVEEAYGSGRDLGEVASDDPVQAVLGFQAAVDQWQRETTPVQDAGDATREFLSGVVDWNIPTESELASDTNAFLGSFDSRASPLFSPFAGQSPRETRLQARGAALGAANQVAQPFVSAGGEITSTGRDAGEDSIEARRDATGTSAAAALLTTAALAEPTPFGEALLFAGAAAAGVGGATASGTDQGSQRVPESPFVQSEVGVPEDGERVQQSGEVSVPEDGEPTTRSGEVTVPEDREPVAQPSEVSVPDDAESGQNEINVPEDDTRSPMEISFDTAVRRGRTQGRQVDEPTGPTIGDEPTGPQIGDGEVWQPTDGSEESSDLTGERSGVREPPETPEETISETENLLEQAEEQQTQVTEAGVSSSDSQSFGFGRSRSRARSIPGQATAPLGMSLGLQDATGLAGGMALTDAFARPTPTGATAAAATSAPFEYRFQEQFTKPTQNTAFPTPTFNFNARRPRRNRGDDGGERQRGSDSGGSSTSGSNRDQGISAGWYNEFVTGYAVGPGAREPAAGDDSPAATFLGARQTETQATATGETREAVEAAEATFSFANFGIDIGGGSDGLI